MIFCVSWMKVSGFIFSSLFKVFLCLLFFPHLFTSRGKLVGVRGQRFEVIRDRLEMCDLSQHRNLLILKE